MSNSNSSKHLHYPEPKKITNRNPVFRSTTTFSQQPLSIKPFSRKPSLQVDPNSLRNSNIVEVDLDLSNMEKSLLEVQSVVSGGSSKRQGKFVRTNKKGFLSPKSRSKKKDRDQSFSPQTTFCTQSMIIKEGPNQNRKSIKDCIKQRQSVESQASSKQQNDYFMHKSVSSSNLFRRNNKTRNMILSKFSQMGQNNKKDKAEKSKLDTSINAAVYETEKEERKKVQKINDELKNKNAQKQRQCENLSQENATLLKENSLLQNQLAQLKKKLQQIQSTGSSSSISQKNPSQTNIQSYYQSRTRPSIPLPVNENKKCQKCEEKQKSNQKQVTYFENIIKKKETEITTLKRKEATLAQQNSQLEESLEQIRHKFNDLLQNEKLASETEQKLQECVNELKEQVARLKDELRYLHIENSVLLKIKNENLKLKIDITKIQDERDYFKMKVMEIHKKNGNLGHSRSPSQKFLRDKAENKKSALIQKSKKFYLDSTETQEVETLNIGIGPKHSRAKSTPSSGNEGLSSKGMKPVISESDTNMSSSAYADALFDLTSEESEN